MPLRILHVIDHLAIGGGPVSVKGIVECSDPALSEHWVCALRQPAGRCVTIDGKVTVLPNSKWDFRVTKRIRALCAEHDIDIVHSHLQRSTICSLIAMRGTEIPVIVHERGALARQGFVFAMYRLLLRRLQRWAQLFIANSRSIARTLGDLGIERERIDVLYNAIDFSAMDHVQPDRTQLRKDMRVPDEAQVIGYVGRLHPIKGVDVLLPAFAEIAQEKDRCWLVLIGDGPQRTELEAQVQALGIADRVRFLGMRDQIHVWMRGFDMAVVPSRYESFGRVQIELMRMRVPVISSGQAGLAEHIEHEVSGLVLPALTSACIAEAIRRYDQEPVLRQQVVERAYASTEAFSMAAHVQRLQAIYQDVRRDKA